MIKAHNLTKTFQSGKETLYALNNVSFEIPEGQFVSIIGKSGSGKSTLLYQLGLLDQPTSGSIELNKKSVSAFSENDRTLFRLNELGYVFQDYAILPALSAYDNVLLPLMMQGLNAKVAEQKAVSALKKVGMEDRMRNLPSQLSGGQQQRVSIARAIAHDPKIIFADEPTANLDTETSRMVLKAFLDLHKEGQTIVMVTHEAEYAAMTERSIELLDGKVISDVMNSK